MCRDVKKVGNHCSSGSRGRFWNDATLGFHRSYETSQIQARNQVCVTGVAKLLWKNHVMQNLRAYFILPVVTIK